ncbi:ZIP family metal transporter [Brevibacillus migulae]|uniref:ZIP family metal transporter n=1 Tax=Brevibacillus migulae TaxID=1644114 RepID=UPI001F20ABC7|nr:ZIP family metal transporter [Brevibacillus migulae]
MEWLQAPTLALMIAVLAASGLGGLLILLRRSWSHGALTMMISTGGGLLLAITLLDLLPHSISGKGEAFIPLVLLGFSSLLVFDLIRGKEERDGVNGVYGVYAGMFVHACMEGMSLMASYRVDVQLGVSLLAAMMIHKIPDGVTVASLFLAATRRRFIAFLASASLGIATLLGMILMAVAEAWLSARWSHAILALTAGIFLYVSTSHLVPMVRRSGGLQAGFSFFAAILVYMLVMLLTDGGSHSHA